MLRPEKGDEVVVVEVVVTVGVVNVVAVFVVAVIVAVVDSTNRVASASSYGVDHGLGNMRQRQKSGNNSHGNNKNVDSQK